MQLNRWDIINHFIKKYNYKTYLEIGYYKGWSFDQVICENKIAVDPNPCKDESQVNMPIGGFNVLKGGIGKDNFFIDEMICKITSNEYFEQLSKLKDSLKFDLIFIDGLHESEQVYRDYKNARKHLSKNGIIIFHDCNPPLYHYTIYPLMIIYS